MDFPTCAGTGEALEALPKHQPGLRLPLAVRTFWALPCLGPGLRRTAFAPGLPAPVLGRHQPGPPWQRPAGPIDAGLAGQNVLAVEALIGFLGVGARLQKAGLKVIVIVCKGGR